MVGERDGNTFNISIAEMRQCSMSMNPNYMSSTI
jgi:hypothetical protein